MKKIFISRELTDDSPFSQQLTAVGHEVHGASLLSFTLIPFKSLPAVDWLFFYSQKGVNFFFEQFDKLSDDSRDPKRFRYAALGPATAKALKYFTGADPYFTGTGYPGKTADYLLEIATGDPICFVQASNSRQSMQNILEGQMICENLIVYDNNYRTDFSLPHFDILVFTSPMNAGAYFSKYKLKENQKVFAIGYTTGNALREMGVTCYVSEEPSEQGLVDLILAQENS